MCFMFNTKKKLKTIFHMTHKECGIRKSEKINQSEWCKTAKIELLLVRYKSRNYTVSKDK